MPAEFRIQQFKFGKPNGALASVNGEKYCNRRNYGIYQDASTKPEQGSLSQVMLVI